MSLDHSLRVLACDRADQSPLFSIPPQACKFTCFLSMFNKLWNFFFPSERHREPPPLPRPRKYPRTTDSIPPFIPRQDGHVAERPESSGQWPRYYPPPYLPPLPQFQLPPQPIPFPNQPMYYNYNPHAGAKLSQ
jgi:hypothetical protein